MLKEGKSTDVLYIIGDFNAKIGEASIKTLSVNMALVRGMPREIDSSISALIGIFLSQTQPSNTPSGCSTPGKVLVMSQGIRLTTYLLENDKETVSKSVEHFLELT